jgi:gliding motility-associated-like protein
MMNISYLSIGRIRSICLIFFFQFVIVFANAQTPCVAPYNPTPASTWGMVQKFQSNAVIWNGGTPTAADLNGDGISEILAPASDYSGYYVYKGDGTNKTTATKDFVITTSSARSVQPAIANFIGNASSAPEVVMVNASGFLYIFASTGGTETNFLFKSTTASQYTTEATPYIVDINEDGTPEIVLGSDVFGIVGNALVKRVAGPALGYIGQTSGSTGTPVDVIVADIISSNAGKELIYGSRVYGINLSTGATTILKDLSTIVGSSLIAANDNGPTAIADMNGDGKLDIVYNGSTFVVMWDPNGTNAANTLLFRRIPPSFIYGVRGLPLIANVFDDKTTGGKSTDLPEAVIINSSGGSSGIVTAYNLNYNTIAGTATQHIWSLATNDMSGCTGITAFDFDGNGLREIVYRDQSTLRIINGNRTTPVNYATEAVSSATWGEYPIVADLNNDGQAEIAVTGNNMLQVFGSDPTTFPWKGAPTYWNQRNYRIVNINSNLTIPTTEINAASALAYNNNAAQFQFADAIGNAVPSGFTYAPDAQININAVTTSCPTITVAATISNTGSYLLPAGTFVAMYDANPTSGAANIVGTYQTTATIAAGGSMNVTMTANLVALSSNVFAVVNDKGTTARPFNLSSWTPNTGINECSYTNNISSKTFTCTDSDGDNVVDYIDIDDDNDGILDTIEQSGACATVTLTPFSATSSPVYGGSTAERTIDGSGFTGTGLTALASAPAILENAWLLKEPETSGFIEYLMPAGSNVGGVSLWAPDAFNYGGGDGPPKDFTVEVTYEGGRKFTSQVFTTAQPNSSGALPGAQAFYFPKALFNVTKLRLNILSGWYDINNNSIGQISSEGITVNAAYNMFLGEFRAICGIADIDTDNDGIPNRLDLDSDGDGCTDAIEAGVSGTLNSGTVKNGVNGAITTTTTLSNAIAGSAGNYGANGLANSVETALDNGILNYTNTYVYAAMRGYASCADTDNDNINDVVDIDDDNDGVLDNTELSCTSPLNAVTPTTTGATNIFSDNNTGTFIKLGGATLSKVSTTLYETNMDVVQLSGTSSGAIVLNNTYQLLKIALADVDQSESVTLKVYDVLGNLIPLSSNNILEKGSYVNPTYPAGSSMMLTAAGALDYDGSTNAISNILIEIPYAAKRIEIYKTAGSTNTLVGLFAGCNDGDTDNDGIPNRLDLDSDGDGCSDAIESGSSTTATSTTTYSAFSAGDDTNSNGLLNVYESATAGVVNYSSQYDPYALSKNLAACKDTDGDGIFDLFDIDDDNDGILDAVESPDCFMKTEEWNTIDKTIQVKITSTLNTLSPNNKFSTLTDNDGAIAAVQFSTSTAQSQLNKEIFKVEFSSPTQLDALYIKKTTATEIFAETASSLKLQGSNDNSSWTDLTAAITRQANTTNITVNGAVSLTNSNKFTVTTGAGKFKYYRIYGVLSANILAGIASEFYFDLNNSTYYASYFPKENCTNDNDADGIFNHQDLDSDGDGCSDAVEAGTAPIGTTAYGSTSFFNPTTTGANGFGANGFLNTLETVAESNLYNGVYSYYYANNALFNACTDTDGDGVPNLIDIDDDNDAILDAIESPTCFYTAAELSLPIAISTELSPYTTNLIGFAIDGNATTKSAFDPSINWVGKELFKLEALFPIPVASLDMDLATWALSSVAGNTFKLQGSNNNNVWTDLSAAQNSTGTTGTYSLQNTVAPTTKYKNFRVIGAAGVSNYGGVTEIRFNIVNSFVQSQYTKSACLTGRTDGDLVPNHLDLDSDGDGCSDALEAGTTTSTTTDYKFTGTTSDFGVNGFYNSLEKTAAESNLYSGIYTYDYATDNAYNCTDTDGDGIPNLIDLDDDNDGILDAVESPTCFYTLEELSNPASVSSELTQHTASYVIGNSIDGVGTTASAFTTGQDWVGKEIFKFTAKNYIAISGMSFNLVNWPLSSASTSTFKLQGSGDNQNWTDLSATTFSSNTTGAFTISNTLAATTKFKYFRLLGVAGTSGYGGVYEAKFTFSSLASPSANPKPTCTNDTDGDGKLNQNDLDSDGDGCSDAVEAGTAPIGTTAFGSTSFFNPATTGANGFLNSLETATESGIYSGTYKYVIALSSALSACLDTDGDGVSNIYDIDDDNDGITDLKELNCTLANSTDGTCTDALKAAGTYGVFTHCSGWYAFDFDPSPSILDRADFDYMGVSGTDPYFDLQGSYAGPNITGKMVKSFATTAGLSYTFEVGLISVFLDDPTTGSKPYLRAIDASTGEILGTTYLNGSGVKTLSFTGIGSSTLITLGYDIRLGNIGSLFWKGGKMTQNGEAYQICSLQDTDNDGVPNQLDLDSDGDACPDAVEAGTTAISGSGVASSAKLTASIIPAPYGNNGFANGLETTTESGLFKGTYTYNFAIDATISGCKDTDGDGVTDVIDLDDDNDGVLDTIEDNCTIAIVNKTGLIITKPSTINYTFNGNTISNLIDGVDNNVYVINGPTGTLNGPWLNFEFPSPKALTYLEIGHYSGQYLFSTTSTYKIQGSSDNTNWTDVSGTLTYNNVATSTSGGLSTVNSNIANFSSNIKAYKYYRILGIDATVGAGWATEIYFKEFTCAIPDLDGDGIPNRLDLDSDGDGCPDAVEAGATAISTSGVSSAAKLSTSTIPAPYGNNGFANGLETSTESGAFTGTYTYNYATNSTTNACTDSDGDGVGDVIDLDDDNDGVLDSSEQINCSTSGIDLTTLTYNGSSISAKTASSFTTAGGDTWKSSYSNENLKLPISLKFKHNSTTGYEFFGLLPAATAQTPTGYADGGYKFYPQTTNVYGYFTKAWDFGPVAILPTDVLSIDISTTGYVTAAINGVTQKAFQGVVSDYKLAVSSYRASSLTDIILTDATRPVILTCTELDTDKDGIPNRLDLDSDGDGCPDAVESGATAITNSGVASSAKLTATTIPAPYGNNGFANGLETATESGLYTGTYTYNLATDATLNACKDTDGDGVPNVADLDDDNDGVPDFVECTCPSAGTTTPVITPASITTIPNNVFGISNWGSNANLAIDGSGLSATPTTEASLSTITHSSPSLVTNAAYTSDNTSVTNDWVFTFSKSSDIKGIAMWVPGSNAYGGGDAPMKKFEILWVNCEGITKSKIFDLGTPSANAKLLYFDDPIMSVSSVKMNILEVWYDKEMDQGVGNGWEILDANNIELGFNITLGEIRFIGQVGPYTLKNCQLDTDGDGILNSEDLDSDGDGCPDAKESGVNGTLSSGSVKNGTGGAVTSTTTVANAIASGPYGNNGLANGVETTTESGVVTYTSTYTNNALVKDVVAPTITTQPLNKTVFVAGTAVLSTVAGTPPANRTLTYQWYKAGVAITGATSATYTVTSSATTANVADYYCTIGFVNSCLTTNTNTVNITVLSNPVGLTACQDGSAVLSVTKTGTNVVTYQWKKATTNLVNGANIAGATTSALTLTNLTLADAGAYTLVATDANGAVITSLTGTITITNNTKYTIPDYTTCVTSSNYTLTGTMVAGTSGATSTVWERSTDGGNTWSSVASGDGVTYTVTTTTSGGTSTSTLRLSSVIAGLNGYKYRIATSNATCTNYSNISTLTVNSVPTITAQPSNSVLCNVFGTSFTAAATGANLTYQWQTRAPLGTWTTITTLNANTIDAGVIYSNFTTTTLNLNAAPVAENNNQYQVLITNSCGTATSTTAVLNPTVATPTITGGNISVCEGTAITLTTSSSTASSTYQWYLAGTAIGGATNNTYNPTASGNYTVIANATGYCSSGTASSTVTINPLPLVAIAQGTTLTLSGGSEQLTGVASPSGTYTYNWYKGSTLVSGASISNSYNVPSDGIGNYTVRATNTLTNCYANSPIIAITSIPSTTVSGSTSFCAGGNVLLTTTLAAGADQVQWLKDGVAITNANSLTYTATASGAYAAKYFRNNVEIASPNTTVATVITVNPIPTAIISNTASGTTLCAGSDAILTASSGAASPTYQWYNYNKIITGATANTYTATSSGNYSFKVTDISCDCSATSISSTVTLVSPPAAPNLTATSKIICVNTTADLTVFQPLAIAGLSYEWHSASNTLSSSLVSDPTKVGTAGTYYLYAKNNSAGCYSNASVAFTLSLVSVGQATLTAASTPTYTIGDIAIALNASTSTPTYSLRWYAASTGGVALAAPVLPSTATAGITNYYVEQYDASSSFCTSNPRQLAAVTVKPLAPIVANITYCENATAVALTATPAIGGTLNWYGTAATGGTLTATATIPATGTVTNTTYYVSQTVNGVEGARAALTVSINAAPSAPSTITGTFSVTSTNSYTYSVTSIANTTYQWTFPSFITGTSTTNTISALVNSAGAGNISVIAINANGCLSPASISNISAVLYVAPPPTTSNSTYTIGDPAIPANTSTQITAATDATINYYTSNAAGSTSTSEQAIPATAGVYTYYVSQTINGVESALVPYTVTIKPLKPVVADITYCQNDVPVAVTATGTALQWYTVSTSGTATSTAPTPSTGTATTTTYYVTQTVNGVESDRIALVVTINPTPATPSAISGLTTTSTQSSEIYSVTNDANATGYVWILPNGWTGTSSINSITATVGLSGGQIKVKAINGSCASPFSTLTVDILNVTNPPLTTDITFVTGSTPSNILSNTSSLITGSASSTINYYTSNESGSASSTSQTTPTEPGVYTYYVSQTSSIGVESILVPYTITVKPIAPPINTNNGIVGNVITYCKGASAFALTATASTGGALKWYTVATGGSPSNSAPTPSTSLVGTSNYYVSQIVNGVESDRVLIVVTVNDAPASITATATQPTCTNSSGYIVITSPLGTGFTYSIDGSNYTNTTLFSALPAGIYFATAKNNVGCVSAPTQITINKAVAPPLSPLVSVVQPTCSTTTGSISITSTTLSTDNFSIDGGLNYQASKIFTGVAPGTYTVTTLNTGGCVSAGTTATINAALPIPAQPSISSSSASASICEGTTVTLTSSALTGNQWYKDGVLIAGAINQTYAPNESGTYTVIATNASGCSSIPSADEVITINPLPTPVISNGATLAFDNCATTVITLTASNTITSTGNTYQWYLNGNSINVAGTNSTYNANQAGNYSVVITNNGCSVTSAISKLIAAPSVNAANTAFCEGGSSLISGISTGFTSPSYQWKISTNDGLSFVNAIGAGTNSLTYTATTAGKYQLQVTDGGIVSTSCPINVTVFTNPTATITASPSAAVCVGSTISLNATVASGTASYTYQWLLAGGNDIAGAALSTYTTGIAGSYAVKVTDANGCVVNAAPSTISFNAVPSAPVVTITNPTCEVTTGTISVTSPLGVGYTYSIDGTNYSNTTGLFTGLIAASTYTVTVKSSTGCTSNATMATIAAALVVPAQPVITGPANVNPNSINTYSVAAVAGATSYSWNIPDYWSGVSTTNTINIKVDASSGSLNVTANSASCVSAAATKNIITTKLNSDINVTNVNVPVSGKLTTNDVIPAGTTYGQPGTNAANPTGASITVNTDGSYTFTATTPGKYTYYIPVCAAGQTTGCPLSPLEITVLDPLAVTDKPVANNDIATTKSGTATTVNILANDAVGNSGGTLNTSSVSITSAPKNGVAVVNSDGTITYTPAAGFVGTDSVVYNVCDNSSPTPLCQTAVVYFTVVPASAPSTTIAIDDYATVLASTGGTNAVSGNVLTNDKNTGGASLTASLVTGPTNAQGAFTMNADGSYTFTPTAGFSGPVDITYTVCTGATPAACATATIHILVEPAQVLNPDAATAYINIEKLGNISTNDVIQPGSTYAQPTQQSGATITVNTDGTYSFTATDPGTYTYIISVCAPGQTTNCPTQTLVITVPVNILVNDAATAYVNIPKPGSIATNNTVPAGTSYGTPVADPTNPAAGSGAASSGAVLTMTANGTYTFTASVAGTYTYTVPVCAPGQTSDCPTETIVFTVPVNTLVNDAANALINIPTSGSIATNDVVPTGTSYGQPAQQTGATITVNTDGTYSFTATTAGTYTYTVPVCAPGQTTNCPTETLVITVPVNTLVNDVATAYVNIPKTGSVATNDVVPTGTTYGTPVAGTTNPAAGSGAASSGAVLTMIANGTYTFTATVAGTYTYTVPVCAPGQTTDCPTETIVFTVPVNTLVNDVATAYVNIPKTGSVATNDVVPTGTTYGTPVAGTTNPAAGSGAASSGAVLTMTANGTYTFTATVAGTYTYTVPVCAPGQTTDCPTETIVFTVPVNTLVNDVATAYVNIPKTGSVATNDVVPTGTTYGTPVAGTTNPAAGSGAASSGAVLTMTANGTYTFTATVAGTYTYTVPVCAPGQTINCPTTTIVFTVPVNTLVNDTVTAYVNIPKTGNVSMNDVVPTGTTYGTPVADPTNPAAGSGAASSGAVLTMTANGTYTFTATVAGTYTYTVPVCAPGQTINCPTETLVFNVPENKLANDTALAYLNIPKTGNVSTNDLVPAGTTYGTPTAGANNPAAGTGAASSGAVLTMSSTGTYTFTATVAGTYTYTVPVCAPGQTINCPTETLVFNVPENKLANDTALAYLNIPKTGNVSTNDLVPAGTTYGTPTAGANNPAAGTGAASSGAVLTMSSTGTYTFTATVAGTYTYTVPVCAPGQTINCPTETLVLNVPENKLANDTLIAYLNLPKTGNVSTNDVVPAGTTYGTPTAGANNPAAGTGAASSGAVLTMSSTGTYTFTATVAGTYTYTVPVCAPGQTINCPTETLVFNVPENKLANDTALAYLNIPKTGNVSTNDVVPAGTTYGTPTAGANNPAAGTGAASSGAVLTMSSTGTYTFTATVAGTYTYTVPVCAPGQTSNCPTTTIVFTVPINRLVDDLRSAIVKVPISGSVATNDVVPTGTTYGQPAQLMGATITVGSNGTFTFTATVAGTYTYTIPVCAPGQTTNCPTEILVIVATDPTPPPVTKVLDVTKVAGSAILNLDGTFDLTFTIKAYNLTKKFIDSVLLKDDLTKVFNNTNGIKVVSVISSGGLIRNSNYDGIVNTDLVTIASSLDSSKVDSVLLRINVPSTISGNFQNTVIGLVPTANGILTTLSTDPTRIVSTNDTVRKPTLFVIPKIPLNIPEGFSPNNDGIDDTWVIRRPMGTKVSVWVINRWGNEVYKNMNYNNDWRGKSIGNILGEDLPEGTYYYIVHGTDVDGKLQKLAGSLTIKR